MCGQNPLTYAEWSNLNNRAESTSLLIVAESIIKLVKGVKCKKCHILIAFLFPICEQLVMKLKISLSLSMKACVD